MIMPDFRKMLPSQARAELLRVLVEKLEGAPLSFRSDPMFTYTDALGMFRDEAGTYVSTILHETFEAAQREYDRRHPKHWDNEKQMAFRV